MNQTRSDGKQVMAIGELLIDFIVDDDAPSLESADRFVARSGGAPANVTVALARLGVPSAFCGVTGDDPFGARLRSELSAEGVDTSRLRRTPEAATTLAYAWKDARGDGHFWILRGADLLLATADAEAARIGELAALVLGSVSLAAPSTRAAVQRAVELAREARVPVVFDVNLRPAVWANLDDAASACMDMARQSDLVKLSLDDAIGMFGSGASPSSALERVHALGSRFAVLTDGERGCWFSSPPDYSVSFVPAFTVASIEPTGAGDAFTAALIARSLASAWTAPSTDDIRFAAAAGALATTKAGAWDGLPGIDQLEDFLLSA